jgi:hypothetical protein
LGVEDFEPLKVIGKGAFGEVSVDYFLFTFLPESNLIYNCIVHVGPPGAKKRHWSHLCNEGSKESRHGGTRTGQL